MIKSIYFPSKQFATKEELFTALRTGVANIIELKKAEIHKSYNNGHCSVGFLAKLTPEQAKVGPQMKDNCIYPIINTTRYMDSHDDAHLDGIWDLSAKQQQGKLYYVADHQLMVDKIIAWPENVTTMVKSIPWSFVGKDYPGNTEALIYEIDKANIVNPAAKQIIDEKRPVQNSVRMQYVKIQLGMNSDAKENIDYKAYYDKHINSIANKDVVEAQGYFFGVEEAKIIKEGSMVILGSNDATAIRQKDSLDTISDEYKTEPVEQITQTKQYFFNANLY